MMQGRIIICATAVLVLAVGNSQAALSNGGFEAGFAGWTTSVPAGASATVVGSHTEIEPMGDPTWTYTTWTPTEGSSFALLRAEADVEVDGTAAFTTLSQGFTAPAGYVVGFDYFFNWEDYHDVSVDPDSFSSDSLNSDPFDFHDPCYGRLLDSGGGLVHEFFHWGEGGTLMGADYSNVGWSSESYTLLAGGTYTLEFGIANDGDTELDSYMGIDNASVVPVPGAVLLGILGLSVAGIKLRRSA